MLRLPSRPQSALENRDDESCPEPRSIVETRDKRKEERGKGKESLIPGRPLGRVPCLLSSLHCSALFHYTGSMRPESLEFLKEIVNAPSPSGYEERAAAVYRAYTEP